MKLEKKLSTKTIIGGPKEIRDALGEAQTVHLYTAYGVATGKKSGESTYGTWECLLGNFRAQSAITGECFSSTALFLPDTAHLLATSAMAAEGVNWIEIAFAVGAEKDEASNTGYVYSAQPIGELGGVDPLVVLQFNFAG